MIVNTQATRRISCTLLLALVLSACGAGRSGGGASPVSTSAPLPQRQPLTPPPTRPTAPTLIMPEAQIQRLPGLEDVIGADGAALLRQFGPARLDVREGDVRKLQFSGGACVLDIYLYPPAGGGAPVATHVEARRASDGQDVDRAACAGALKR